MANIKISDLTAASAAADANEFEINEAGTSKKVTGAQISALVESNLGLGALATLSAVGTTQITDGSVTNAKLGADAVDGTKIADDAIDSEHYVAGSIDNEHLADGAVSGAKIASEGVTATAVAGASGTSGQVLQSDGDGTMSWTTVASGATLKAQVFTAPGTWTKPANTNWATATVVGGGGSVNVSSWPGGGNPGGTSSFGGLVVATGGTRSLQPNSGNAYGASGTGTVNAGQAIRRGGLDGNIPSANSAIRREGSNTSVGLLQGATRGFPGNATAYSVTGSQMAGVGAYSGAATNGVAGWGGVAIGSVPVSTPQSITVGAAGNGGGPVRDQRPTGGAVVVEWVE